MSLSEIILALRPCIKSDVRVHAMWLEGSYATGKFRDDSDIDVWLDVDPTEYLAAGDYFVEQLRKIHPVSKVDGPNVYSNDPYLVKYKIYLEGKTSDNRIELDIQGHDRNFVFDRNEHELIILFDKDTTIKWKP